MEQEYKKKKFEFISLSFSEISDIIFRDKFVSQKEVDDLIKRIISNEMFDTCNTEEMEIRPIWPIFANEYLVFNQQIETERDVYNYWVGYFQLKFQSEISIYISLFCTKRTFGEHVFKYLLGLYPKVKTWSLTSLDSARNFWERQGFVFPNENNSKGVLQLKTSFELVGAKCYKLIDLMQLVMNIKEFKNIHNKDSEYFVERFKDIFEDTVTFYVGKPLIKYNIDYEELFKGNVVNNNTYFILNDKNTTNIEELQNALFCVFTFNESKYTKYQEFMFNTNQKIYQMIFFVSILNEDKIQDYLKYIINNIVKSTDYWEINSSYRQKQRWLKAGALLIDDIMI